MFGAVILFGITAVYVASPVEAAKKQGIGPLIVGGSDANIVDYSYQLSLLYRNSHICGASAISETWALTAAHCMILDHSLYSVRAGSSFRTSGGVVYPVVKVFVHGLYNIEAQFDYDFTLLKIGRAFDGNIPVASIELPSQGQETSAGSEAVISGWGTLEFEGDSPEQLQVVRVPVTTVEFCRTAYGASKITDRMICAGTPIGGIDSCQGDSGGPMVVNKTLVGVVSFGDECALPGVPGVYSKVSSVRDWINVTMYEEATLTTTSTTTKKPATTPKPNGAESVVRCSGIVASLCVVIAVIVR